VKDEQLKIAQGFVVCTKCEGLFKATENIVDLKGKFQPEVLPTAMTDLRLSRGGKMPVQSQKQLSRNEIADLFDSFTVAPKPAAAAAAPASPSCTPGSAPPARSRSVSAARRGGRRMHRPTKQAPVP